MSDDRVTEEMIEAGRVAYFHFRAEIEGDVTFGDLTEEEQEDFARRTYLAMRTLDPSIESLQAEVERYRQALVLLSGFIRDGMGKPTERPRCRDRSSRGNRPPSPSSKGTDAMKLTDLDARWLVQDGRRVGCTFRCPTDRKWWQIVPAEPIERKEQWRLAKEANDGDWNLQAAGPGVVWQFEGGIEHASFETLTLHPSVDGSKGGLWHGWVRGGEMIGV